MSAGASRRPVRAFVGLGSNLANPPAQLREALVALAALAQGCLTHVSRFYRTPPMGPAGQPDYLNAAACLETRLEAHALLDALQGIERAQGRRRGGERWGPRPLDLDLLLYGGERIDSPRLRVPHPGVAERIFVLRPLADIAPAMEVPGLGPIAGLLAGRREEPIEVVAPDA